MVLDGLKLDVPVGKSHTLKSKMHKLWQIYFLNSFPHHHPRYFFPPPPHPQPPCLQSAMRSKMCWNLATSIARVTTYKQPCKSFCPFQHVWCLPGFSVDVFTKAAHWIPCAISAFTDLCYILTIGLKHNKIWVDNDFVDDLEPTNGSDGSDVNLTEEEEEQKELAKL